jgi:hypothetical protein
MRREYQEGPTLEELQAQVQELLERIDTIMVRL